MKKIERLLRSLEEKLLEPTVRKSRTELNALLTEDFREFAADGTVYDKSRIIRALLSSPPCRRSIRNFKVELLARGAALATFKLFRVSAAGTTAKSLRSSIWTVEAGRWRMRFHQGTPL